MEVNGVTRHHDSSCTHSKQTTGVESKRLRYRRSSPGFAAISWGRGAAGYQRGDGEQGTSNSPRQLRRGCHEEPGRFLHSHASDASWRFVQIPPPAFQGTAPRNWSPCAYNSLAATRDNYGLPGFDNLLLPFFRPWVWSPKPGSAPRLPLARGKLRRSRRGDRRRHRYVNPAQTRGGCCQACRDQPRRQLSYHLQTPAFTRRL